MKYKRNLLLRVSLVLFIFVVLFSISVFFEFYSVVFDIITVMTAIIGAYYIWLEFRRSRDLEEANFILTLNENFNSNQSIQDASKVVRKSDPTINKKYFLAKSKEEKQKYLYINDDENFKLMPYFTFFETMNLLIKRKIIDISIIDELFTLRFFEAADNPVIQDIKIATYKHHYRNIYELHNAWRNYKILHHKKRQDQGFCLSNYYDLTYGPFEFKPLNYQRLPEVIRLEKEVYDELSDKSFFNMHKPETFESWLKDLNNYNLCIYTTSGDIELVGFANLLESKYITNKYLSDDLNIDDAILFHTLFVKNTFRKNNILKSVFIHFIKTALFLRKSYMIFKMNPNDALLEKTSDYFGFETLKSIQEKDSNEKIIRILYLSNFDKKKVFID